MFNFPKFSAIKTAWHVLLQHCQPLARAHSCWVKRQFVRTLTILTTWISSSDRCLCNPICKFDFWAFVFGKVLLVCGWCVFKGFVVDVFKGIEKWEGSFLLKMNFKILTCLYAFSIIWKTPTTQFYTLYNFYYLSIYCGMFTLSVWDYKLMKRWMCPICFSKVLW